MVLGLKWVFLVERWDIFADLWFVVQRFQENLVHEAEQNDEERDQYFGLSLRELVHTYKWQTLVLFKCLLLQPKVIGWIRRVHDQN